ncbi:MAG: hypothetical protein VX877_11700 [Planctomycetota bacterium]|nr:hypothetical protein [Planctomycetota bacterium]MED5402001.1 hypothetical protein [Planctomycetota bacterium]MED5448732.1 hypothetical protein [Planctomycetota bacterium]
MRDRTATLFVDASACDLDVLVHAAEQLGYTATVRSIEPFTATPAG